MAELNHIDQIQIVSERLRHVDRLISSFDSLSERISTDGKKLWAGITLTVRDKIGLDNDDIYQRQDANSSFIERYGDEEMLSEITSGDRIELPDVSFIKVIDGIEVDIVITQVILDEAKSRYKKMRAKYLAELKELIIIATRESLKPGE
jgi:hypothetical protein